MRLLEYEGRLLLQEAGITVPNGEVADSPTRVKSIAESLGGSAVVKAQVPVGGRGKAGGIKVVQNSEEAEDSAASLIGTELTGETISKLLIVEAVEIETEFYLSVVLDRGKKGPVIIFSPQGGVDIEEVAATSPDQIFKVEPDPVIGLQPFMIREIIYRANTNTSQEILKQLYRVVQKLYDAYQRFGATLVEINPLAVTKGGDLVALDSKVKIDDDSSTMDAVQELLPESEKTGDKTELERQASESGLQYVELEGDIGIIGNGAGLVMSTLDVLSQKGGQPANFLDVGGGADSELVSKAFQIVTAKEGLAGVFINIFGGITRCDEIAKGLVEALSAATTDLPVVVRLTGTNEKAGRDILREHNIPPANTLDGGVDKIMEKVNS